MDLHARHHRRVEVAVEFRERYWYPDDGGEVWVSGFHLVDDAGHFLGRDAPELEAAGLIVCGVAGARAPARGARVRGGGARAAP